MIFNISSGGVAYISVTAPASTAVITATLGTLSFSITGSGNITVTSLGTWNVTCSYGGVTSDTRTTTLTSFGSTSENISFVAYYSATIRVTTHPSAYCSATYSGKTIDGYANSSGICDLTVPAGYLGTWDVTASNGSVSDTKSTYVGPYGTRSDISILTNVPVIVVTISGSTYTYKGATIDNGSNLRIAPNGSGWKAWIRASATVKFTYLNGKVSICAVGRGGAGGSYSHPSSTTDQGGGGGGGGGVVNANSQSLSLNTKYTVTIGDSSSFGSIAVASRGGSASGISGGSSGGNSGNGGSGAQSVDTGWSGPGHPQISYSNPGNGENGVYAFGDSSFDGVVYAHGGQGGDVGYGTGKRGDTTGVYANPGAGGAGGGSGNNNPTSGNYGLVMMRNG